MPEDRWWAEDEYILNRLEANDRGVKYLMARRDVEGVFEYAIVWWFYNSPTLDLLFKNGEILYEREK